MNKEIDAVLVPRIRSDGQPLSLFFILAVACLLSSNLSVSY